jgi:penicillin-binding protein 1A
MVGSADYLNNDIKGQFNVVTDGLRQPGSSFKPYAYEQAFKSHKLTMGNMLDDTSRHFANGQFHDFDFRDMGMITAHQALLLSRNIPALETMQAAGVDNVVNFAHDMGITTQLKSEVTTAIGSSEVRLLDHAVGYGVFANGGTRHDPVSVLEVKDRDGNTLDKPNASQGKQVISAQEAYLITYILKDYSSQWNLGWTKPFAGKSGTTNNYRDAWMMAYSPNLVVGAWVGHTGPGNQDMNGVYGSMVGSSVLRDFINTGLTQAHFNVETFKRPDGLIDGPPCASSATASPSASPGASPSAAASSSSEKELYLPGTECKAAPTPSPSPSLLPSPSDLLSPLPSILPSFPPSPAPSASPSTSATPAPTPTPTK